MKIELTIYRDEEAIEVRGAETLEIAHYMVVSAAFRDRHLKKFVWGEATYGKKKWLLSEEGIEPDECGELI